MSELPTIRHNVLPVTSIAAFANIRGQRNASCKDVSFVRAIGVTSTFVDEVLKMDNRLMQQMQAGHIYYKRIQKLPALANPNDVTYYTSCYEHWLDHGKTEIDTKTKHPFLSFPKILAAACAKTETIYDSSTPNINDSMRKNFIVKLLYWFDQIFSDAPVSYSDSLAVKIVLENITKKQDYFFAYLLTLLGCDVLLLQTETDIDPNLQTYGFSKEIKLGTFQKVDLPPCQPLETRPEKSKPEIPTSPVPQTEDRIVVHIPERKPRSRPTQPSKPSVSPNQIIKPAVSTKRPATPQAEKSFEELALLASSVVMIGVHDASGKLVSTGSGIMIGKNGYILTNQHVIRNGRSFSVRIEEDEQVYSTDEVIKYHTDLDLAVIRIQRQLSPLPIYNGAKKLVRGQKVVAIGSPLGLFNSVSDGIISGFRKVDGVDMIQFTAPISAGSSGGAVLNLYGEVIGISTATITDAENINLAVSFASILPFTRGFTG
ncbi:MAG: trypsin-like peptidase domain-containing protein [Lachnospiraceae bacterium]